MITRVVISNFKNFCGEETIVLSSPSDESYVDVLVGRNGSGKSCLLESIDWCLCNRTPRDIRASSMKDLVNINSVDGKMNVIVYIVRGFAKETQTLEVSRHFNGRTSKLECKLFSCGASEMIAPDCVPGLLADFGMAPAQMSGIRIKQHQSQVACRSPLELLTFIETMCGSIEKKLIIDDKIEEISRLNNTLKECNDSLAELKAKSSSLDPFVANIERCLSGLYLLRVLQMDLIDRRLDLLCADHADIKRRLGADSMTKKTILNDIIELEALISAANLSNALTNAAEKQHRKLYETTKRMQKRVNKDKDSQCRLISEQEALLMGLKRSISNGNKKREKQSSKNELMRIDVCHIKSEIFSSEQFFIKLEAFKASDALTAECRSACDIYWATDRIIESMRSTMQQISTKMTNFDVYICSLQDSKKANNAILTKIAVLEGDIAAQRSKKKLLEVDICESKNKIRLYEDRLAICCQKRVDISTRLAGILNSKNLNCPSSEFESFTDSLRSQFIGIEGMLLRLGSPISNEYCTAILTVLGVKAFRTVVVRSRECAVLVADKMNIMKLNWSSIIICDELVGKQQESMRHSSHHQLIPLVSVMNFPSDVAKVVFESKLLKWMLFTGNANESIKISELFKGINVVCLDGCQFLADGEIKLSFGTSLNSFENTDCKNENMHGWILGASTYSHEKQIELEHDLASMCDDIDNIESHILSTSISLEIMENDYRDIENTINKKDRNINELRFAITTDPISPDINIAECTKELEHYTEMENDRSQQRCLIENLVKNQVFENMDVMEIIANANAHQRTIHMGRSKLRILKNGLTSGEHFLNVFAAELKAATDDLDALELKILHENVKHAQHKETVAMIAEDFSSRYIALMCVRENLETITKILKKHHSKINLMRMEINELDLSIIISHDRMHICKTSIETDGDFKIFLIKDCDRIKDIRGFDAASDHETSKYQQADKMTIDRAIEDASCQVDYISSQLDNLDMTVLEESKSVSKNICDVMESIDCIRYEIQRLHEDILIVTGNRYKLITFALDDINKSIGTFYENLIEGGECYLSYPGDSTSLFAEGIQFIARYEDRCWTDIKKLSGGQQAACGFALLVSFQDMFPSPAFDAVYILDEVDAALDTRTAYRMGQLLRQRSLKNGTQFIVVSHHPELQVAASRIIGFYHHLGRSTSISVSQF